MWSRGGTHVPGRRPCRAGCWRSRLGHPPERGVPLSDPTTRPTGTRPCISKSSRTVEPLTVATRSIQPVDPNQWHDHCLTGHSVFVARAHDRARIALAVAGLAAGVATVVTLGVLGRSAKPDPARLGIGTASDFPAGSITRVERSVPFFDAVGLEAGPPSSLGPHRRPGVRVFVTHDSAGLHALLARAPSYGCQIVAD